MNSTGSKEIAEDVSYDEAWKEIFQQNDKWEKECMAHNELIINTVKASMGHRFVKSLMSLIQEIQPHGKYEIVKMACGHYQEEKFGRIAGYWVDQVSMGTEGDSFAGDVYVKLYNNFFKMIYEC